MHAYMHTWLLVLGRFTRALGRRDGHWRCATPTSVRYSIIRMCKSDRKDAYCVCTLDSANQRTTPWDICTITNNDHPPKIRHAHLSRTSHLPVVDMHINPLDRHQRLSTARRATVIDFRSGSFWRWITDMDVEGGKGEGGREPNAIRKNSPGLRANQARGEGGRQTEREKSLAPVLVEKG
jgi:hypothetical protein